MKTRTKANVIAPRDIDKRVKRKTLPSSWLKAAGLLKGKKKVSSLRYQKKTRAAWQ